MKKLFFASLLFIFSLYFFSSVLAKTSLEAKIDDTDPLNPFLRISNRSNEPCVLVKSALGTVIVNSLQQNAHEIPPQPVNVAIDDDLEMYLAKNLQIIHPDDTIDIPLKVVPNGEDHALQTVTWSRLTGPFGMVYPLDVSKPYLLTVTYSIPFSLPSEVPLCELVSASNGNVFNFYTTLKKIGLILLLFFIFLISFAVFRSKISNKNIRKKKVTVGLLLLGVLLPSVFYGPVLVKAEYTIPESSTGAFDRCLGILEAHPDITGDVLNRLDGARIDIYPTGDGSNWATDWPDGSYRIYWDPTNEYNYYSDDGSVILSTPCDRLFHEMYHIYELMNGTFSREYCGGTGIETKEVNAVRAQNRLRVALGLAPRTHYGTERLPAGECEAPSPPDDEESVCRESETCGDSTGEPHLTTFDGLRYDFQAVGEFVLTRDSSSEFQVQVRQQPWPSARDVSRNTAVAMKMGESKIEFRVEDRQLKLFINGQFTPLQTIPELESNGKIVSNKKNEATVIWPDNSKMLITSYDIGLNVLLSPNVKRAGKLEGLLGDFNAEPNDDTKINGKVIVPDFDHLYPRYADSWRVTDSSSLFTYSTGTNTQTYTDTSFPDRPVTSYHLSRRAFAESLCKQMGVVEQKVLDVCVFDVAWTGRPEFAYAAKAHQQAIIAVPKVAKYDGLTWKAEITKPGESAEFGFDGIAGEEIFVMITNSSLKYQCGGFGIKDPNGSLLGSGCIIDGAGMIDTIPLVTSGKHFVFFDPSDDQTGRATVQIVKAQHFIAPITINGPSVVARFSNPGSHATLTFDGQANQRVFVELVSSTISDQCGGFLLSGPTGQLESTCLHDGQGTFNEEGIVLPKTGTYTISLDPANENTGTLTVKVRM